MRGRSVIVGRAILPAAAFQAALSGNDRPVCSARPAESRPQPGLAAPQSGQNCQASKTKWHWALGLLVLFAAPWLRAQTPGREQFEDLSRRAQAALDSRPDEAIQLYKQALGIRRTGRLCSGSRPFGSSRARRSRLSSL